MKTLTPLICAVSTLTPSLSLSIGTAPAVTAARRLISSFHSAAFLGAAFMCGGNGPAIIFCISGLTSSVGTGMVSAGVWRAPGWLFCAAADAAVWS